MHCWRLLERSSLLNQSVNKHYKYLSITGGKGVGEGLLGTCSVQTPEWTSNKSYQSRNALWSLEEWFGNTLQLIHKSQNSDSGCWELDHNPVHQWWVASPSADMHDCALVSLAPSSRYIYKIVYIRTQLSIRTKGQYKGPACASAGKFHPSAWLTVTCEIDNTWARCQHEVATTCNRCPNVLCQESERRLSQQVSMHLYSLS